MAEEDSAAELARRVKAEKWTAIATLRADRGANARIDQLLSELANEDDLDAIVQQALLALDQRVERGELKECEGFAKAMEALARAVSNQSIPGAARWLDPPHNWPNERRSQFLGLAWAYLISHGDHLHYPPVTRMAGHEPPGGWEDAMTGWVTTHEDANRGSGYMPPQAGDSDSDRSGRKAHLISNALMTMNHALLGDAPRNIWSWTETSSTDNEVNRLGAELGHLIALGRVDYNNIADWITKNLCTEGQCKKGSVSPELLQALRYGTLSGSVTSHEETLRIETSTRGNPRVSRHGYSRDDTMTVTARVLLPSPDAHEAQFGHPVEGVWQRTQISTQSKDGQTERQQLLSSGPITEVSGSLWVKTDLSGSYDIQISGTGSYGKEGAAADPEAATASYSAGKLAGHVCVDGTLSGEDSRRARIESEAHLVSPGTFGEMLDGGGDAHTTQDLRTGSTRWSWKFTITPASPPPEHKTLCDIARTSDQMYQAAMQFLTDVNQHLVPLYGLGNPSEPSTLMADFMNIYSALSSQLAKPSSAMETLCGTLDALWIRNDEDAANRYIQELQGLRRNVESYAGHKEQIIGHLSSQADSFAARVRFEDGVAASNIDELARRLRVEGLEAFVR